VALQKAGNAASCVGPCQPHLRYRIDIDQLVEHVKRHNQTGFACDAVARSAMAMDIVQHVLLGNVTASLSAYLKIKVRFIKQNYTAN